MTRSCRSRAAILLGIVCLLTSGASAQSSQQYALWSSTHVVGGCSCGGPARTWQVYRDELAEVEIAISLANEGEDTLYFNSGIIERALSGRLFSVDDATGALQERAVRLTIRGVLEQDGSGPFVTLPDQLLLAEGRPDDPRLAEGRRSMVVWIVAATQPDGRPFAPGRYRFDLAMRDLRSGIVTAGRGPLPEDALRPWSGVTTQGDFELRITAPSTPAEVAAMYVQRAQVARDRRQLDEAVALFRQAVDAHPSSSSMPLSDAGRTLQLLGGTYLQMGRYAEALPVLQRLPIRGQRLVQAYLAGAYIGVGNEAEAVALLRRNGCPEADVAERIENLRATVRTRPRR